MNTEGNCEKRFTEDTGVPIEKPHQLLEARKEYTSDVRHVFY